MSKIIVSIVIAVITSQAFFGFLQFVITRADTRKNIDKKLEIMERDVLRTQLLFLISMQPDEDQEILTVAEHYFRVLHGDWYMTSIFNKWLIKAGIAKPEWFSNEK